MQPNTYEHWYEDAETLREWANNVFLFTEEAMGMRPSEPIDELRGKPIRYTDAFGNQREVLLFDQEGRLTYHDLSFYTIDMFKNQSRKAFAEYNGTRFTWQQTVTLTAYNRALWTFGLDSYDLAKRWISVKSGHGTGKTGTEAVIALHFLVCLPGSQIGMTANTEQQVQDIFLKEFSVWKRKLPQDIQNSINQTSDHIRIDDSEDWFLRAQVARAEKPEALAGLHGKYVLIIVDEASGVDDKVFEVMKGALTGEYYIVIYCSNPTRNEGEFFESHKKGSRYTKLSFSSRQSPIVKEGFIEGMEADYPGIGGQPSDKVLIRVDGEFAGTTVMDEKGWIPLFANVRINFEPENGQIINRGIISLDPAGSGKDRSIAVIRDNVYLKEVLNEQTSEPKDLARKLEVIRDAYNCSSNDIGIEAFGVGAKVVGEVTVKIGEHVTGILTDKPREGTEDEFDSYKMELAWKFRAWLLAGGIIITNNAPAWLKELEKIKYKRTKKGAMQLMPKPMFKKEYNFSPDRFDSAIHSFFKDEPTRPVHYTKEELQTAEIQEFLRRAQSTANANGNTSSM
jgi:hypothetical protein